MTTKVSLIADNAVTGAGISNSAITADDIADSTITTSKINFGTALVPLGGIIMWSGVTAPSGYQLCNGSDLPSTSPLRPGVTKTPDLRDRFIVGTGSGYGVGATGGAATVTLTTAQMPSHSHGGVTGTESASHNHIFPGDDQLSAANSSAWSAQSVGQFRYDAVSRIDFTSNYWLTGDNRQNHHHIIGGEGGGKAHENRPPYYALAFIMRVA
jgi:microcystin-dependent protein